MEQIANLDNRCTNDWIVFQINRGFDTYSYKSGLIVFDEALRYSIPVLKIIENKCLVLGFVLLSLLLSTYRVRCTHFGPGFKNFVIVNVDDSIWTDSLL